MDSLIDKGKVADKISDLFLDKYEAKANSDLTEFYREVLKILVNEKGQPWVSVKDRLPKCGESVLIYIANLNGGKGSYALDKCRKVDGKKDWEFYNKSNADFNVTHWKPLYKPQGE